MEVASTVKDWRKNIQKPKWKAQQTALHEHPVTRMRLNYTLSTKAEGLHWKQSSTWQFNRKHHCGGHLQPGTWTPHPHPFPVVHTPQHSAILYAQDTQEQSLRPRKAQVKGLKVSSCSSYNTDFHKRFVFPTLSVFTSRVSHGRSWISQQFMLHQPEPRLPNSPGLVASTNIYNEVALSC